MALFEHRGFPVEFIAKSIKHCYLRVKPSGVITLTHNKYLKKDEALKLLDNHWDSILQKLSIITPTEEKTLDSGTSLYFLGQKYTVNVINDAEKRVELNQDTINLHVPNDEFIIKDRLIRQWYNTQARVILSEHYYEYLPKVSHWSIVTPTLRYRTMKRRWGSYNKKANTITLNTELIKATPEIINYIIAHELCHTLHFNHSKEFYTLLTYLHPNWKEQKRELDNSTFKYLG